MLARILLKRFVPAIFALAFIAGTNYAIAQDQTPEVQVDTSVLDDLGPHRSTSPVTLTKPEQEETKRVLTAPSEPPAEEPEQPFVPLKIVPPPGTVSHPPTETVETPLPVPERKSTGSEKHQASAPAKTVKTPVPARKLEANAKPAPIQKFPITEKMDTDSINPAAPKTAPAPAPDLAAALSPAVPRPAAMPRSTKSNQVKLSPKRAKAVAHAISTRVTPAIKAKQKKVAAKTIARQQAKLKTPPAMPAVPTAPVKTTTLSNDNLAQTLSTPDRHKLAEDIDNRNTKAALVSSAPQPNAAPPANPNIVHTPAENVNAPGQTSNVTEAKHSPRPPPSNPQEMNFFSAPCKAGADDLEQSVTSVLQAQVLPLLKDHPTWKLQIQSFASPTDNEPISARKISLSRALAVRSWLLDKGVEPRRMEVRALGLETDREPTDRVDMVLIDPDANGG